MLLALIIIPLLTTTFAETEKDSFDILIIGAGITSLAQTHLLSTLSTKKYKTLTVERFNRVCGRTHSSTLTHDSKSISFEHGAMRFYYDENHQKFLHRMNLCENIVKFEHKFFSHIRENSNFFYRNILKKGSANLTNYFSELYNINSHELEWMDANNQYLPVSIGYHEILEENKDKLCSNFWESWTLRGVLVKDWDQYSYWKNVLNTSIEYYNYENKNGRLVADVNVAMMFLKWVKDTMPETNCGFGDNFPIFVDKFAGLTHYDLIQEGGEFWNTYIEPYYDGPEVYTLDIGYDSICKRLYNNVTQYDFNEFLFEYNVISINKKSGEYKYEVILQSVFDKQKTKKVRAKKVISTIAPEHLSVLLKNVNFGKNESPTYNDYIQNELLDSVFVDESYKISLIYDDMWWKEANLYEKAGHLLTDNNIQTVLMEEAWTNETLTVVHFYVWGPQQSHLFHRLQQFGDKYIPNKNIEINNANTLLLSSKMVVNETLKQLSELVDYDNIPLPLAAYSSPLGFNFSHNSGVWRWKAGYNPHYTLDNIIKPIKTEDFYITTSSISPNQGWMYGGIWAALQNIEHNFGITKPLENEPTCLPSVF